MRTRLRFTKGSCIDFLFETDTSSSAFRLGPAALILLRRGALTARFEATQTGRSIAVLATIRKTPDIDRVLRKQAEKASFCIVARNLSSALATYPTTESNRSRQLSRSLF
jgi:hypothetical protein